MPKSASVMKYLRLRSMHYIKIANLSKMVMAYPAMKTHECRVASFAKHDGHVVKEITPDSYAEAGFFSYGKLFCEHDAVTCFFCAGTIANWLPKDDPWELHALHFPDCMYVYLKRGKNFVNIQLSGKSHVGPYEPAPQVNECQTRYECKICFNAEISVVYKPCDHMITCYDCAPLFSSCPWCKTTISNAIRCIIAT
uniref:RING-type domain-containing protein n=1 Tax=Tetranychus urticae TaxID=32264 RepID=T1KAL6_TETUR